MQSLDVAIVFVYLLGCIILGISKSKLVQNIKDYTLGNNHFSTAMLVSTIFATSISSSSSVGKIENIYKYGLIYAAPSLFIFIYWLITARIFAKIADRFKGCLSLNEIMQNTYGAPGLVLTNCSTLIDSIGFITIQFVGMGTLLSYFFNIPYLAGVLTAFFVVTFYSFWGGIRSVLVTDVFQFLIFFIVFPIACGFLYRDVGGYESIRGIISNNYKSLHSSTGNLWVFFSYLFYCLLPTVSAPNIQRMLIAKNKRQIVHSEARQYLEKYIAERFPDGKEQQDAPMFLSKYGNRLSTHDVIRICHRISNQAYAQEENKLRLNPHMLRHSFLKRVADKHGVHVAQKMSGNISMSEIFRYTKPSQEEIDNSVEELF